MLVQPPEAIDERAIISAPKNSPLGKQVASERANNRRSSRMPPRSTQAPTPAPTPWVDSPEGEDAAIAYTTGTHADNTSKNSLCFSAVAFAHALAPPQGARIANFAIDSGATWHLQGVREDISDFRPCHDTIAGIDGAVQKCLGIGTLNMIARDSLGQVDTLSIKDVRLAPNRNISLLSASQLMADRHFRITLASPPAHLSTPCGATLPLRIARRLFFIAAEMPGHAAVPNRRNNNACAENRASGEG